MHPESPIEPLPEDAILVHLGPHKTGTTAIQSALEQSRADLARHDVHYPGSSVAHHREARALIQRRQGFEYDAAPPPPPSLWADFARDASSRPGRVVISSELLAEADEDACARLVHDLGPERVHLVVGARNPAGIAMSSWQQVLKTFGRFEDFDTWLEASFRRDDEASTNRFWRRVDTTALVSRWLGVLPLDRITVVALDEGERHLLPRTFEQLLGLPDGLLAEAGAGGSNRGLTAVELALLRGVNAQLRRHLSWVEYSRLMRSGMISRLIAQRRPGPDEHKVPMPDWAVQQALVEADRNIAGLRATGVQIAGDLESLRTVPAQAGQTPPITTVPLELAVQAVVHSVQAGARERRRLVERTEQLESSLAEARAARRAVRKQAREAARAKPPVDDVRTRDLMTVLAHRVRRRLRRSTR